MSNSITAGLLAAWPAILVIIGRFLVVFGFNEGVVNGIGLATKGRLLKAPKAHIFIFFVSLGVVIAPLIADMGSTANVASMPAMIGAIVVILTLSIFAHAQVGYWRNDLSK